MKNDRVTWTPEKIKALRRKLGESQDEFAKHFRVSVDALQHWEQGRGRPTGPVEVILERIERDFRYGKPYPQHQKETEFHGSYQEFSGTVISPDDPRVKDRVRSGRPADSRRPISSKKRGGRKPKK